jgi:hypothetical protein
MRHELLVQLDSTVFGDQTLENLLAHNSLELRQGLLVFESGCDFLRGLLLTIHVTKATS